MLDNQYLFASVLLVAAGSRSPLLLTSDLIGRRSASQPFDLWSHVRRKAGQYSMRVHMLRYSGVADRGALRSTDGGVLGVALGLADKYRSNLNRPQLPLWHVVRI